MDMRRRLTPCLFILALLLLAAALPSSAAPAPGLAIKGPLLARPTVQPGEKVVILFALTNAGPDALFDAALDIRGPGGQIVYQSRNAAGRPGRSLDIDRDSTVDVTYTLSAPRRAGVYSYRLLLRKRSGAAWQDREPDTGWAPLFTVAATAAEVADSSVWSADDFARQVKQALEAMVDAYQRQDAMTIMRYIAQDYRGFSSTGGSEDRADLSGSLQGDFQIFSYYDLNGVQAEAFRVTTANRQAEVILFWNAYARFDANNTDINMRGRRTRLVFTDEDGQARLLYQDIATVRNGTVLIGQTDALVGKAVLFADAGSTAGYGRLVATAASWGAMTVGPE